jgi:hypothetical protein
MDALPEFRNRFHNAARQAREFRLEFRNEFRNATRTRGNFVTLFVTPSISALARHTIGIVARAAAAPGVGKQNSPPALTAAAMISSVAPALLSASTIALTKSGECHRLFPTYPHGRSAARLVARAALAKSEPAMARHTDNTILNRQPT